MHNWIARLGLVLLLAGCDRLADEQTEGVALATLHGTLALGQGVKPPARSLRISVLWQTPIQLNVDAAGIPIPDSPAACAEGQPAGWRTETPLLEQSVRLTTDFPSGFSVALTEPPPAAALRTFDAAGSPVSIGFGDIVVYEDRNGNDRLDPSTFDATSPDLIFGSSQGVNPGAIGQRKRYTVKYLSRDLDVGHNKAGYSLQIYDADWYASLEPVVQRLSEATIELMLDPTPYAQQVACTVRCDVNGVSDCDDTDAVLAGDLGVPVTGDLLPGVAAWSRADGDSTVLTVTQCSKESRGTNAFAYMLDLLRVSLQGCTKRTTSCVSVVGAASPDDVHLPCTQYRDVVPAADAPEPGTPP